MHSRGFNRRRAVAALAVFLIALLVAAPFALAARGGGGSGGSRASGSGGSRPSNSGSRPSYKPPSKPTAASPSTGSRPQRPVTKIVPLNPPKSISPSSSPRAPVRVPVGRNYSGDAGYLRSHPQNLNPYGGRSYFGDPGSIFFYIWLASIMDDDSSNNALPPQAQNDGEIDATLDSYGAVIEAQVASMDAKATP